MAESIIFWILGVIATVAVLAIFALTIFILLHRMGRATSRFDRREKE